MADQTSELTAAYQLGQFVRAYRDGMIQLAQAISAGFNRMPLLASPADPHRQVVIREAESIRRYQRAIATERAKGLTFVRTVADRARRDLGLEE